MKKPFLTFQTTNILGRALCLGALPLILTVSGCAGDRYHRSTGETIDDKSIQLRVRDALNENPSYKYEGVKIACFKGTVQLSGFVDSYAQKYSASSIARKVQGVRGVENNITMNTAMNRNAGTADYVDDQSLASHVKSALGENAGYKFEEVSVTALKGEVQLSGFVNNAEQKTRAGDITRQVSGVQNVVNNITVKDKL